MKKHIDKIIGLFCLVIITLTLGNAIAQQIGTNADPNGLIEGAKGEILPALSENALWIKSGGQDKEGWVKFNFPTFGGAVTGAVTLTDGVGAFTNTSLATNAFILLQNTGAVNLGALGYAVATNGVVTVTSSDTNAAHAVNYLILGE
jgi:hypothetical protein